MGSEGAVGIHRQLAASEARVPLRPADDEPPRRVEEQPGVFVRGQGGESRGQHLACQPEEQLVLGHALLMLGGQDHRLQPQGFAHLIVLHGDLGFPVRAQEGQLPREPGFVQPPGDLVGQHHGQGQVLPGLIAGVAHYDALVPGALLPGNALGDVQTLPVEQVGDEEVPVVIAHVFQHRPDDVAHLRGMAAGDLPRHDDVPLGGQYLAGHMGGRVTGQAVV